MVVIAEHELMKTELQFAIIQGIPVQEKNERKQQKGHYKANLVRPEDIKGKLKQWRILFYLDTLRDVDMTKLLTDKEEGEPLYIQIKLFEYFTKFILKSSKSISKTTKNHTQSRLPIISDKEKSTFKDNIGKLPGKSSQNS